MNAYDTYRYRLILDGRVAYHDCTNDLVRRTKETQQRYPNAYLEKVGNKTTRKAALRWVAENEARRTKESHIVRSVQPAEGSSYSEIVEITVPVRFYWVDEEFDGIEFGPFSRNPLEWETEMMDRCMDAVRDGN